MLEGKEVGENLVCEETRVSSKGSLGWERQGMEAEVCLLGAYVLHREGWTWELGTELTYSEMLGAGCGCEAACTHSQEGQGHPHLAAH